jgi:hypothetical protein
MVLFSTSQAGKIGLTEREILFIVMRVVSQKPRLSLSCMPASPSYAIAGFAYWIDLARGDLDILNCFVHIPDFDQLLLRVTISKLMVHHEFRKLGRESANDIIYLQLPMQIVLDWLRRDY